MSFKNGFILGALVGGVLGVMYAPRPGRQSRERFKSFRSEMPGRMEEFSATASEAAKDLRTVWNNFAAAKKSEVEGAFGQGRAAADQAKSELEREYSQRASGTAAGIGGPPPGVRPAGGPPPGVRPAGGPSSGATGSRPPHEAEGPSGPPMPSQN